MHKPFFSVIIPTYNRHARLKRAVNSVLNQSFQKFELIIVDDASTDETKRYLETLECKKLILKENKGVSFARNRGVEISSANWICFLDSDDEWFTDKLQKQFDFIQENPDSVLIHGEERWIRNGKRVNQMKKHKKSGGDIFERSLELCLISPSAVCLKKSLLNNLEGFREDFVVCEDYDLWLKITSKHLVGFIEDEIIYKYGGHEDQLSSQYKAMDYYRVKSIDWILQNRDLSVEKKERAIQVLKKKCEILLKGYKKHCNYDNQNEILKISSIYK